MAYFLSRNTWKHSLRRRSSATSLHAFRMTLVLLRLEMASQVFSVAAPVVELDCEAVHLAAQTVAVLLDVLRRAETLHDVEVREGRHGVRLSLRRGVRRRHDDGRGRGLGDSGDAAPSDEETGNGRNDDPGHRHHPFHGA
jgi:hypothetical protein